jgi:hypothetical protein
MTLVAITTLKQHQRQARDKVEKHKAAGIEQKVVSSETHPSFTV